MPLAARFNDMSAHGGKILIGTIPKVLFENLPAAVQTSMHTCPLNAPPAQVHPPGPLSPGSPKVFIGGLPAVDVTSKCVCGAPLVAGLGVKKIFINN